MQNGGEGKNSLVSSQVSNVSQRKEQLPETHEALVHGPLYWRIKTDRVGGNWRSQSPIRALASGMTSWAPLVVELRRAIVPLDCDHRLGNELGIIFQNALVR